MDNGRHSTTIYLAARYSRNEEMRRYRDILEQEFGFSVTSRWIDQHGNQLEESMGPSEIAANLTGAAAFAAKDIEDVRAAQILIHFTTGEPGGKGGRHTEMGIALALGKHITIIGPRENVFQAIPHEQFDTWDDFYAFLQKAVGRDEAHAS